MQLQVILSQLNQHFFLAAFLYATIVQYNDPDGAKWYIFYSLQTAIPLMFWIHFFMIIMIVLVSIELKNWSENDKYYDC